MRFHIHRWRTIEELPYAEYRHKYHPPSAPPLPQNPIPPSPAFGRGDGLGTSMALQECRCGARRSEYVIGPYPPRDTWERPTP